MKNINRLHTSPNDVPRTRRRHDLSILTSMPAGKCVPLAAIPLLREDSMSSRVSVAVEMLETDQLLMNPVNLRVTAHVVPFLAFERFEGSRDQFDRSYMGEPQVEGGSVVDFIETVAMGAHGSKAIFKYLGLHAKTTDEVNTMYAEAYNCVVNYRRKQRSKDLAARLRLDYTLAEAFWPASRFQHVVPDFDLAVIDGEVALNIINSQMPVKGIGAFSTNGAASATATVRETGETGTTSFDNYLRTDLTNFAVKVNQAGAGGFPEVYAEMAANGITVSLSSIEQARKMQAFAKLRARYEGFDDDYIIDMLMDGLEIPDQALKQPILLADKTVRFAQAKRYATDSGNLAESAVSGAAINNLSIRVPRLSTGGVVIIMAEAVPEQLFERQRDPFFHSADIEAWPEFVRDSLDDQKVDVVTNAEIDTDHATPAGTFGYAPMNWKWTAWGPRVGGKFYRPTTNTGTDTDRKRIWAVEAVNPALAEDFYIVSEIHTKPFLNTEVDPFEATVAGQAVIEGNTQFGGLLLEATANYDAVKAKAPTERIETTE